jgi:hypothetical protein
MEDDDEATVGDRASQMAPLLRTSFLPVFFVVRLSRVPRYTPVNSTTPVLFCGLVRGVNGSGSLWLTLFVLEQFSCYISAAGTPDDFVQLLGPVRDDCLLKPFVSNLWRHRLVASVNIILQQYP